MWPGARAGPVGGAEEAIPEELAVTLVANRIRCGPGQLTHGHQPRAATMFGHHPALWALDAEPSPSRASQRASLQVPSLWGHPETQSEPGKVQGTYFHVARAHRSPWPLCQQPPMVVIMLSWPWGHAVGRSEPLSYYNSVWLIGDPSSCHPSGGDK